MSALLDAIAESQAVTQSLASLAEPLTRAADLIRTCLLAGGKLLACGNGGSSADVSDFTTEYACRFQTDRRPFPALNLAASESLITATGNDYAFDEIFARGVWAFGKPGDILVGLTTSGNSRNIIRALQEAQARDLHTIAFLGKDGGAARGLAEVELLVPSPTTARIQEAHKLLLHTLCAMVEPALLTAP